MIEINITWESMTCQHMASSKYTMRKGFRTICANNSIIQEKRNLSSASQIVFDPAEGHFKRLGQISSSFGYMVC